MTNHEAKLIRFLQEVLAIASGNAAGDTSLKLAEALEEAGVVVRSGKRWHWPGAPPTFEVPRDMPQSEARAYDGNGS